MILLNHVFAFLGLLIGSISDLKTREVPDWLNFSLVGVGLGSSLIFSIVSHDIHPFLWSVLGFGACFLLAMLMYYSGQWGGGDSKMIMGLGALIGLNISDGIPLLLIFIINIIFVGAVYGLFWTFFLALKNFSKVKLAFRERVSGKLIFVRRIVLLLCFLGVVLFFFVPNFLKLPVLVVVALVFLSFYLWIFVKVVEDIAMVKDVLLEDLTEGDWVLEDVFINNKKICGPADLGISKGQIQKLLRLKKAHKLKHIKIKFGIPFIPSFFIAFLLLVIFGNWLFFFF
ncbi:MAG: A24 family peptidase [Nanoarchaeota archaeon]|nr:A24 family peptidase [Nanoarchaeota archaeon]MBU1029819.1 A24 family peptidase [Nanoarchaeota archaeon]